MFLFFRDTSYKSRSRALIRRRGPQNPSRTVAQQRSATNPENGTVTYTYNNGQIAAKTDAKGQQIVYTYDASLRLTQVQRFPTQGNEDICQRTTFHYDANPFDGAYSQYTNGRTTAVEYGVPMSLMSTGGGCPSGVPSTPSTSSTATRRPAK